MSDEHRQEISVSIDINASPAEVWNIVSDLKRMGEWSPQCRRMYVRGGEVGVGTRTLNINRKGLLVWPTRAKVTVFEPERELAFRVRDNGTIWTYVLEPTENGTRVTETRTAPNGVKKVSTILTKSVMGGVESFENELEQGMQKTLERIKSEVEA